MSPQRIPVTGIQGHRELLDYYLLDEILEGCLPLFTNRIQSKLAEHQVQFSKEAIYSRAKRVLKGGAVLCPSADVNGKPAAREGKDKCYAGFWTLVDIALPNKEQRNYIGLAANQLDVVKSHIAASSLVVCEIVQERMDKLKKLADFLEKKSSPTIILKQRDIFRELEDNNNKFNIFDLDLMIIMPPEKILDHWAQIFYNSAKSGNIVLNLVACVGRNITIIEHQKRVQYLQKKLEGTGFNILGHSPFSYRDRRQPMYAERFLLNK